MLGSEVLLGVVKCELHVSFSSRLTPPPLPSPAAGPRWAVPVRRCPRAGGRSARRSSLTERRSSPTAFRKTSSPILFLSPSRAVESPWPVRGRLNLHRLLGRLRCDLVPKQSVTSRHVRSRHDTSRHVTSRHNTSCHVTSRHVTSQSVMSRHVTSRHVTP